jgi:uncharacterized delta-60 repeat protein
MRIRAILAASIACASAWSGLGCNAVLGIDTKELASEDAAPDVPIEDATAAGDSALAVDGGASTPDALSPKDGSAGFTLALAKATARLVRGHTISVGVTVDRLGGFGDAVAVAVNGLPSGVTVAAITIPASQTTGTLVIQATAAAALGGAQLSIVASGTVQRQSSTLALVVQDASSAPDVTFATAGRLLLSFGIGGQGAAPGGLAILTNGSTLICGNAQTSNAQVSEVTLARLTPAGALDPTFGDGGVTLGASAGSTADVCGAMVVLPSGAIDVAGFATPATTNGAHSFMMARFTAAGAPDPTFGSAGFVTTAFGSTDAKAAAMLAQDGGTPILGGFGGNGTAFARYLTNGAPDPNFGALANGTAVTMLTSASDVSWMASQSTGNFVAAVDFTTFLVERYASAGVLDTSFGTSGHTAIDVGGQGSSHSAVVLVQPDDSILVVGTAKGSSGSNDVAIARLTSAGQLDKTFATAGWSLAHFDAGNSVVYSAVLQDDGTVIVAGQTPTTAGVAFTVLRFAANGALDTTFGTSGRKTFETAGSAEAIAVDALGRIVVAGRVTTGIGSRDSSVVVYRLWP